MLKITETKRNTIGKIKIGGAKALPYTDCMHISWVINYLIVGMLFQWFMHWVSTKLDTKYIFTHLERVILILIWPIGVFGFIYNFVRNFLR